ncbi:acyl carrier protein [Streptomyces scopuliridis]
MHQPASAPADYEDLESWLVERVGQYLPGLAEPVDPHREIGEYGLDSIAVVAFVADVEDRLAISVDPTAVWDHPTIAQLAKYLMTVVEDGVSPQAA